MKNLLPELIEIQNWNDEKLKQVYDLLFNKNINPSIQETNEEVEYYLYCVDYEFNKRKL